MLENGQIILALIGIVTTVIGLFGWLLKRVMEENSKREANYQRLLNSIISQFNGIKESMDGLTNELHNVKGRF